MLIQVPDALPISALAQAMASLGLCLYIPPAQKHQPVVIQARWASETPGGQRLARGPVDDFRREALI